MASKTIRLPVADVSPTTPSPARPVSHTALPGWPFCCLKKAKIMTDTAMTAQMPGFRFSDPAIAKPEAPAHIDIRTYDDQPSIDPGDAPTPRQLKHWTAYRSGATLSISGMDPETGATVTVTGITSFGPDAYGALRINGGDDARWELLL